MKGYIYKIYDNTNGNVYYGSTIQKLSCRISSHRANYKKISTRPCKSFEIIKNGDYSYCVVEEVICENKWELCNRERFWIENNECINKVIPNRTKKEYRQKNKEKINEYQKQFRQENKEKFKQYYQNRKEKLKEKIICECGCSITKSGFSQHKKSKKHLLYLDSINAKSEVSKE